jgi:uncharacterized protein (TIGR00255 family)
MLHDGWPMNSMTGFGRGDAAGAGVTWAVEVSSVNRKQLEVVASLPRELNDLEGSIRNEVSAVCSRGRVSVHLRCDLGQSGASVLKVNEDLARQYATAIRRVSEVTGLVTSESDPTRWPGVIELERVSIEADTAWPLIEKALRTALQQLVTMRAAEGQNLKRDISDRLARIAELLQGIEARAKQVPEMYRKALLQRLQDAGLPLNLDDERLIKEIAVFADRCDVSEELSRARSHLAQFDTYMASREPMGRSMDFLTQELFREFNTMGSKANNAELAHLVVAGKSEIEKIREQIQNVE